MSRALLNLIIKIVEALKVLRENTDDISVKMNITVLVNNIAKDLEKINDEFKD